MNKDVKNVSESTEAEGTEEVVQGSEETKEQSEETEETPQKAGDKTPPNLLLESLQTERELRRQALEEKKRLEEQLLALQTDGSYSEEGLRLKSEIDKLREELSQTKEEKALELVRTQYPAIKDKADEFTEFRKDYPGIPLEKVAKLFVVENDLGPVKERKGLERGNTGTRTPTSSKMTPEEVKDLRENNFRKYQKLVREGKI